MDYTSCFYQEVNDVPSHNVNSQEILNSYIPAYSLWGQQKPSTSKGMLPPPPPPLVFNHQGGGTTIHPVNVFPTGSFDYLGQTLTPNLGGMFIMG